MTQDQFLTARQLSPRLNIPAPTLYRMAAKGLIPWIPVGEKLGGRRFVESEVRTALASLAHAPRANLKLSNGR